MSETKTCNHCGKTKPIDDFILLSKRLCTGGESKRYRLKRCRHCWNLQKAANERTKSEVANSLLFKQVKAMLKKYGMMTAGDLALLIGGISGHSISMRIRNHPDFVAYKNSRRGWLWAVPGYEIRRNRSQKRLAMTAPDVKPIHIGAARPPIIVPEKRPIQAAPPPPPQPPMQPQWHQPEHDAWYAALQAEVAARKAAQAAMRGRV